MRRLASTRFLLVVLGCVALSCACPYLDANQHHPHAPQRNSTREQIRQDRRAARKHTAAAAAQRKLQTQSPTEIILQMITQLLATVLRNIPLTDFKTNDEINTAIASAKQDINAILNNDLSSELVRLAFHDCVGGVCDGCVDLTNPDNFGLEDPIEDLEDVVEEYAGFLTRGDIWVLAAYAALERQQNNNNGNNNNNNVNSVVSFDLEYVGRPSCDGDHTRGPDRALPSPHLTTEGLVEFFGNEFSFDTRETTAIMGAHTLGKAVVENSGFDGEGGWVPRDARLDNQFYGFLLDDNLYQQQLQDNSNSAVFTDRFLWRRNRNNNGRGRNLFMLNADMALVADMGDFIDPDTGAVTCSLGGSCPDSELLEFTDEFAGSNTAWMRAFHDAYLKMTNVGCAGCRPVV